MLTLKSHGRSRIYDLYFNKYHEKEKKKSTSFIKEAKPIITGILQERDSILSMHL